MQLKHAPTGSDKEPVFVSVLMSGGVHILPWRIERNAINLTAGELFVVSLSVDGRPAETVSA